MIQSTKNKINCQLLIHYLFGWTNERKQKTKKKISTSSFNLVPRKICMRISATNNYQLCCGAAHNMQLQISKTESDSHRFCNWNDFTRSCYFNFNWYKRRSRVTHLSYITHYYTQRQRKNLSRTEQTKIICSNNKWNVHKLLIDNWFID